MFLVSSRYSTAIITYWYGTWLDIDTKFSFIRELSLSFRVLKHLLQYLSSLIQFAQYSVDFAVNAILLEIWTVFYQVNRHRVCHHAHKIEHVFKYWRARKVNSHNQKPIDPAMTQVMHLPICSSAVSGDRLDESREIGEQVHYRHHFGSLTIRLPSLPLFQTIIWVTWFLAHMLVHLHEKSIHVK